MANRIKRKSRRNIETRLRKQAQSLRGDPEVTEADLQEFFQLREDFYRKCDNPCVVDWMALSPMLQCDRWTRDE